MAVRCKVSLVLFESSIQFVSNDSRLNPNSFFIDGHNGAHVPGKIDYQTRTDCTTGNSGPCSTGNQGKIGLSGITGQCDHVVAVQRIGYGNWRHLIQPGVAGIQRRGQTIAVKFTPEHTGEIFNNQLLLFVHVRFSSSPYYKRSISLYGAKILEEGASLITQFRGKRVKKLKSARACSRMPLIFSALDS